MKTILILALLISVIALAACSGTPTPTLPHEITIEASAFKFQPATVETFIANPVRIVLRNSDTIDHDLAILKIPTMDDATRSTGGQEMSEMREELQLHVSAKAGQTAKLEFIPIKPGTYQFLCTVAGHQEAGMVGNLVVR